MSIAPRLSPHNSRSVLWKRGERLPSIGAKLVNRGPIGWR
jgi:hypothetical protein